MFIKFVYIIIFCLCLLQGKAQGSQAIKKTIDKLAQDAKAFPKDSSFDSLCRAKILDFGRSISLKNSSDLNDSNKVRSLIDTTKNFISFTNEIDRINCFKNARARNIANSAKRLVNELNHLMSGLSKQSATQTGSHPAEKTPLSDTIKIVDSSGQKIVDAKIRIVDSAGKEQGLAVNANYFEVSLDSGIEYTLTADAPEYDSLVTKFKPDTTGKNEFKLQKKPTPPNPSSQKTTLLLVLVASALFVITLAVLALSVKTRRGLRLANAKISDLTGQIKSNQQMEENKDNKPMPQPADENAATTQVESIPQANETASTTEQNEPVINKPNANAYFVCELMMTAGPRKEEYEDVDLGEDVCGFISNPNEAIFWVLDGTSDADRLWRKRHDLPPTDENVSLRDSNEQEYFSSRLLAQSIGNEIKTTFTQKTTGSLNEIVRKIIKDVKKDWQKTLNELHADDKKDLDETVKHKSVIQCSTTVLIARLSINGELTAYRVGDSKMLVFENTALNGIRLVETELQEKSDEKMDRIFFSLQLNKSANSNQSFHFISNIDDEKKPEEKKPEEEKHKGPKYQEIKKENIGTIISFSDGVGIKTQTYLKEEYQNDPESVRKQIMYQNQATEDDKSMCFIEIKQPANNKIE